MTIASLEQDLLLLAMFLLAGFTIREYVKPLQRLYIPASVIGGALALICGQQVLGLVVIPKSFNQLSGTLINLVMTALVFGVQINRGRARNYLDYALLLLITYGLQLGVGGALGLGMQNIWPDLPQGWGTMGVFAFWGGHGNSGAAGAVFQQVGIPDNLGMGMILSTIGLIVAVVVGMILVNWGIRKGYATRVTEGGGRSQVILGGVLPPEQQKSIGTEKVPSSGISNLAFQFCLLSLCLFVGYKMVDAMALAVPALKNIPGMARGMLGAAVVWGIMAQTKLRNYADIKTCHTISGFALELIIVSAIATLRLDLVTTFLLPILVYSALMVAMMLFLCPFFARHMCKTDWFEKMLLAFGQGTGTTATGLALVRCADPDLASTAPESSGIGSTLILPITGSFPALVPLLLVHSEMSVIGIGFAIGIGAIILGRMFFWNKG